MNDLQKTKKTPQTQAYTCENCNATIVIKETRGGELCSCCDCYFEKIILRSGFLFCLPCYSKKKRTKKSIEIPATEHIFKYVAKAHPGINECSFCGIGYGLYEYRNTLTNEKVFSCCLCIKTPTKGEHLQKIIIFTTAFVNKKIWFEQYVNEFESWFMNGLKFFTSEELREIKKEANRQAGLK